MLGWSRCYAVVLIWSHSSLASLTPVESLHCLTLCNGACIMLRSELGQECFFLWALQLVQHDFMLLLLRLLFLRTHWNRIKEDSERIFCISAVLLYPGNKMTCCSLCSAMTIRNTNIFVIALWAFMFISTGGEERETPRLIRPSFVGVRSMVGSTQHAAWCSWFAANRDLLSTLLYLELCKLFSRGTRNWVTLFGLSVLVRTQNLQAVSKRICHTTLLSEYCNKYSSFGNNWWVCFMLL